MRRLALAILLILADQGSARPPHKQAVVQHFGAMLPAALNACTLCHLAEKSATEEKPHNAFGKRLKTLGQNMDIVRRWESVAEEDSDGDGIPNILEILAGHAPGNAGDKPTDVELTEARRRMADYRRQAAAYRWRPFEPVQRPALPVLKDTNWVRNPIDQFVAAERDAHGLTPRPEAPRAVLLRRVYFDLIGLAPTEMELRAFLQDDSSDAFEKVVDRLLASARYGERWGRHWMDVWRYSDWAGWTDGGQIRDSQPHIWHWRDWIIEALNADKGYHQMILEMLAADELAPTDDAALRATGFLARNYKMLSREKWLQDTVDHTFLAFQGLTIGCARCHDHMYDPVSQSEYYQVRAIFTPHQVRLDRVPGEADVKKAGLPRVYDSELTAPTFLLIRGDDRTPAKTPVLPGVPSVLGGKWAATPVSLPRQAHIPDTREFVMREAKAECVAALDLAHAKLRNAQQVVQDRSRLRGAQSWLGALALVASMRQARALERLAELEVALAGVKQETLTALLSVEALEDDGKKDSADWKQAAEGVVHLQRRVAVAEARRNVAATELERAFAALAQNAAIDKKLDAARKTLAQAETESKKPITAAYAPRVAKVYPSTSSGRRLAFARWLSAAENPLTARVAVNHIWLRHFGQALAPSVFDFGRNGRLPTHPALLDWLAAEFMRPAGAAKPWSMKHLHRLIVTSATYRMASTPDSANLARDQDNRWLWRMPPRRLEAEIVRDNLLHVAKQLEFTTSGPDIDHQHGLSVFRRSLYFRHAAEKQMEFLKLFDAASVTECYQRKESVIPQQALALANSELSIRMARLVGRELATAYGTDARGFVCAAFERIFSRAPTAHEVRECLHFIVQQTAQHAASNIKTAPPDSTGKTPAADPAVRARENLIQVLINHHEFVTIR